MSELVEREKVIEAVHTYFKGEVDAIPKDVDFEVLTTVCGLLIYQNAKLTEIINKLQTVKPKVLACGSGILVENTDPDVIRVVRCKDCAWWQKEWSDERDYHYCTMEDDRTYREFYCANAERREVDTDDWH